MGVNRFWLVMVCVCISACGAVQSSLPRRIALLAPFEGRYREIGYNAYYAARLAFADAGVNVELLPIDDGGSIMTAVDRAEALVHDPQVMAVLVLGYFATAMETQHAFADIPVIVVGHWSAQPDTNTVFMLASRLIDEQLTMTEAIEITEFTNQVGPIIGSEIFALAQFPRLRESLEEITIISSASLPDEAFTARYEASGMFVPEPGLLATLTYDGAQMAIIAVDGANSRADVVTSLSSMTYEGLNGVIRFESGYWADAPVYTYRYDDQRRLILAIVS